MAAAIASAVVQSIRTRMRPSQCAQVVTSAANTVSVYVPLYRFLVSDSGERCG